jgi:hypothetical protein
MRVSIGLYKRQSQVDFDDHLNDLITFKAKDGHCDVISCIGEDASDPIRSKCNVHVVHGGGSGHVECV